jgi:hypothetical protein
MTRSIALGVLPMLVVACVSQLDVGLGAAGSTSDSDASNGSGPIRQTADATGGSTGTTGSTDASSTSTSSEVTTDSGGSTGDSEGLEESPCASEQKVCAQVELDGAPAGFCGETLELKGITQSLGGGRWSIEDCDACALCGGDVYEIEFFAPAGWEPTDVPLCSRIAIDFAPLDESPFACAFTGVAIWADTGGSEDPAPAYVAASITTDPPAALGGLQVDRENLEPKPCDETYCCHAPPGKYSVTFTGAGIGMPITLAEHEEALDVGVFGLTYDIRNERSHAHPECDRIPHFDWIMRR